MKKAIHYLMKSILLDTIVFAALIFGAAFLLSFGGLMFREWVIITAVVLIILGVISGIIQLLLKIRKKWLKVTMISLFAAAVLFITPFLIMVSVFMYQPSHVVEREEGKYVAYVISFQATSVDYHEYVNFLVVKDVHRISEFYGGGHFDPFVDKESEHTILRTEYFNELGQRIRTVPGEE